MISSKKSKQHSATRQRQQMPNERLKPLNKGNRNTADFRIEFDTLAIKADMDELHAIFLLKKNI